MVPQPSAFAEFAAAVRAGLLLDGQKTLPCRYFYDEVGSALFEAISVLPEYGLTRADSRLIRAHAAEVVERLPGPLAVVELGSGSGAKTRWILEALCRREPVTYYPIDVSTAALFACRRELEGIASVTPLHASYLQGLREAGERRTPGLHFLVLFLGSTIGNFDPEETAAFLSGVREALVPGDAFLLGADLEKADREMLLAYDDPAGVTAAFNRNLLARINRELGGDFAVSNYNHEVRYDRARRRIEMHLRATAPQRVSIREAGIEVELNTGETIWTESSYKFRPGDIRRLAETARFACAAQWIDEAWPFSENLLLPC